VCVFGKYDQKQVHVYFGTKEETTRYWTRALVKCPSS